MNTENQRLERLLALARRSAPEIAQPDAASSSSQPPLGFATRVAARWANSPRGLTPADVWERVSWWGSGLAAGTCLLVFAFQQPAPAPSGFDLLLGVPQTEMAY